MTNPSQPPRNTPLAEWISAAIGAALIILTLGSLTHEAMTDRGAPPDLRAEVMGVSPAGAGYRVEFRVSNLGSRAAAGVNVVGEIEVDAKTVEDAETLLDYVAPESIATGALQFASDPRQGTLSIRVVGYQDP
jgi:uncharacterized protein (TIGR02588 family)